MTETVQENFSAETLQELNERFAASSPQEVLAYALERFFPKVVLACSFGAEDMVLWDMMHRINPQASLFYLDTDFLFPETHAVRDRLIARYKVSEEQVIQVVPALTPIEQAKEFGEQLWVRQPDQCCRIRKVDPLTRILKNYSAWVTGIRRDQSPTRATAGWLNGTPRSVSSSSIPLRPGPTMRSGPTSKHMTCPTTFSMTNTTPASDARTAPRPFSRATIHGPGDGRVLKKPNVGFISNHLPEKAPFCKRHHWNSTVSFIESRNC